VSPALFATSNNITSVTVGGSANTISLTFDSNGIITGASNNALSVANTAITGLIQAAQIGSANATLVTSGTLPAAALPAGSVLQVVMGTFSTQITTTSSTMADTGLTATITPRSTSSSILVTVSGSGYTTATNTIGKFNLVRASTTLICFNNVMGYNGAGGGGGAGISTSYLDSPATTSATTYKVQWARVSGAGNTTLNNPDAAVPTASTSTITLMEIAG
jgi:hypothetical protein